MSCKYKNSGCQSLCDVIYGYCQFQTMEEICPIYHAYVDFDKYIIDGGGDDKVLILGNIVGAADSTDFRAENLNLNIGKNN